MIEREAKQEQCHDEDDGQPGVDDQTHEYAEHQTEGSPHGDAQHLLIGILQRVDVSGHTRNQS